MQEAEVCPKCGKSKQQQGKGSLTQWISACTCFELENDAEALNKLQICQDCGKRIGSSREGSFTQWIFRQDLCECQRANLVEGSMSSDLASPVDASAYATTRIDISDEALELELSDFPKERYAPYKELGSGKLNKVYLSKDRILNKLVAVKVMNTMSPEQVVAFQKEAKATSALSHPNIVKILDFGAGDSGAPYMVLEYEEGRGLDKYIAKHGSLELADALTITSQVCSALSLSHKNGIFHRDIKPGNILLVVDDEDSINVRIIDFGIASSQKTSQDPTIQDIGGEICGTPAYMSPEQASGDFKGATSEIYSIGCVLYECLTGKQLIDVEDSISVLRELAKTSGEINIEWHDKDIPDAVKNVVARCLDREPSKRYQSVGDLESALEKLIEGTYEERPALNIEAEEGMSVSKSSGVFVFAAVSTILVGGLAFGAYFLLRAQDEPPNKEEPTVELIKKAEDLYGNRELNEIDVQLDNQLGGVVLDLSDKPLTNKDIVPLLEKNQYTVINLANTAITDELLKLLVDQKALKNLDLSNTAVTEKGLSYIEDMPLESLKLDATSIISDSLRPISKMKTLRKLSLKRTKIGNSAIEHLVKLPRLGDLDLSHNNLSDELLDLAFMKRLKFLNLVKTNIGDDTIQAISSLKNLKFLHIDNTLMTNHSFDYITKLKKLENLSIGNPSINPFVVNRLQGLKNLHVLLLDHVDIKDSNIRSLTALQGLEKIYLKRCSITDNGVAMLASMPHLKRVHIIDCPGVTGKSIRTLANHMITLSLATKSSGIDSKETFEAMGQSVSDQSVHRTVNLSGAMTTDDVVLGLDQRPIEQLKLSNASITDEGLKTVAKIKTLRKLYLNKCKRITGKGIAQLASLNNLEYLSLNGTNITNDDVKDVAKIKSIKSLRLMDLSITGDALKHLVGHPNLIDLDVNRSQTGDGISVLRTIDALEMVRVGTSGVTDKGVRAIDGLPNLRALHIQGNKITRASLKIIAGWPKLDDLWIIDTNIKPRDLPLLKKAKKLKLLRADTLNINDSNISYLTGLKQIETLTIRDNPITDKGLLKLASMTKLKSVDVTLCKSVTYQGIGRLLIKRPDLAVKTMNRNRPITLRRRDFR